MVMFTHASRSVARLGMVARTRSVAAPSSRRTFASSAPREYEGFEATVRQYLPEDHHVVLGCLGLYFSGYLVAKLVSGGGKADAAPAVSTEASTSTEIPSLVSEEFEEWSKIPGNMEKWEASIESWANKL